MLHSSAGVSRPALVAVGFIFAATPVAAQAPSPLQGEARLQGVVVHEESYEPVESARVLLVGLDIVATTGRWGAFAFPDAPVGTVSVRVSAPGHPSVVQDVEVRGDRVVFVRFVLPTVAATLSELMVRVSGSRDASVEVARTAADLLALQVPRTRVSANGVGRNDYQILLRPGTTLTGNVAPMILIDGVVISRAADAYDALMSIPASDVEEIKVLKGPAATSLYPLAANGVVLVRTKKGR